MTSYLQHTGRASKFTIGPTPYLPINEMRIHPCLFFQEPRSNETHYRISTLEKTRSLRKLNKVEKFTHRRHFHKRFSRPYQMSMR